MTKEQLIGSFGTILIAGLLVTGCGDDNKYVVATPNLLSPGLGKVISSDYYDDINDCFTRMSEIISVDKRESYTMKPKGGRIFSCVKYGDLDY